MLEWSKVCNVHINIIYKFTCLARFGNWFILAYMRITSAHVLACMHMDHQATMYADVSVQAGLLHSQACLKVGMMHMLAAKLKLVT